MAARPCAARRLFFNSLLNAVPRSNYFPNLIVKSAAHYIGGNIDLHQCQANAGFIA